MADEAFVESYTTYSVPQSYKTNKILDFGRFPTVRFIVTKF